MRACSLIWILLVSLLVPPAHAGDRVIARVGSEAVTQSELAAAIEQNPDLSRTRALDLLIERRLVLVWAAGKNITISDEEVQQMETTIRERNNLTSDQFERALASRGETIESFRINLAEQLTINRALGMALSAQAQISDTELQEFYLKTYPGKTVFDVSHILLPLDPDATSEEAASARSDADRILREIENGASFDAMARQYSQDKSSAEEGGRLGSFQEGELLPELEELAATLEPGQVGGPARTEAGYHILLLSSKGFSEPPPFAEVRGELERALLVEREESIRTRWLDELKETTYIEVFPDDG